MDYTPPPAESLASCWPPRPAQSIPTSAVQAVFEHVVKTWSLFQAKQTQTTMLIADIFPGENGSGSVLVVVQSFIFLTLTSLRNPLALTYLV